MFGKGLDVNEKAGRRMMSPKAADFECFVDGKPLAWNDVFGLRVRWRAARASMSSRRKDLDEGARLATAQLRKDLNSDRVLLLRRAEAGVE